MAAPKENTNAEKWTEEQALELFNKAIDMTNLKENGAYLHDFIGEVARELDTYHQVFTYLGKKYTKCEPLLNKLKYNLEANCFFNTKKGNIKEATGIVNLKSNYKWTDRVDNTTGGEKMLISEEEKEARIKELLKKAKGK